MVTAKALMIGLPLITACADLPDPLTCDRDLPECMEAVHRADRRAEKERTKNQCPMGAVCVRGHQQIERFKRQLW